MPTTFPTTFSALYVADDGTVWVTGSFRAGDGVHGLLGEFQDGLWQTLPLNFNGTLNGIGRASGGGFWLVGGAGKSVYVYSPLARGVFAYSTFPPVTDRDLYSVAVANSSLVWSVGAHGTVIAHSTQASVGWVVQGAPTVADLYGISMLNPDYGFVVGEGVILQMVHGSWVLFTQILSVAAVAAMQEAVQKREESNSIGFLISALLTAMPVAAVGVLLILLVRRHRKNQRSLVNVFRP